VEQTIDSGSGAALAAALAEVERLKFLICIIQEDAERLLTVDRDCSLACLLQHCRDAREGREVIG